ncbi:MAG: pathogenicity locus [Desulfobacteraceae bacterium IS3]|nr:MAG: pathogenicity locus [Desulfobacteraceae bacterium IS3]
MDELQSIPGVGNRIAEDLRDMGIFRVSDLKGRNPEQMYDELCALRKQRIDRCMLYVFRCAVYYVENASHEPELLKWWNWKDNKVELERQ